MLAKLAAFLVLLVVCGLGAGSAGGQVPSTFAGVTVVGQSSAAATVTVHLTGNGLAVLPVVKSQTLLGGDFSLGLGGSCLPGLSALAGLSCTVSVVFQPTAPGLRLGVVLVLDGGGNLLGEATVSGVGQGPLAVLDPGNISTVAGDGDWIYRGDNVLAVMAPLFLPTGVVVDTVGNLYISDSNNNRIRRVDVVTGLITTVAGTGTLGYSGDGGPAVLAMVSTPAGITMDGAGNLYFADTGNQVVRRIDAITGLITTVAGQGGVQGYKGDGGAATAAALAFPQAVTLDAAGDLYIADTGNNVVREVLLNGTIVTVAGTGTAGYNGDGIPAKTAEMNQPWGLALGTDGTLYIADLSNNLVRRVDAAGLITTVAGTGQAGFAGDKGPAISAQLKAPAAVAMDPAGNLYIADSGNNRVRKVYATTGMINTIAGVNSEQFAGDNGLANIASLYGPYALSFDGAGDLFVADLFHNRIREISANTVQLQYAEMRVGKVSPPQAIAVANDGNTTLTLTQLPLNNAALDAASTTCAANETLAPGLDCAIGAEFAPTSVGNPVTGTITVENSGQATPLSAAPVINLSGQVLSVNPTAAVLSSSLNPSALGSSVTFTATVSGGTSLTGTIVFQDGATQLCSVTMTGLGATCTVSTLALGSHNITAAYSGDAQDAAATSAVVVQVVKQQPAYVLKVTPNPAVVGATVTLSATATVPGGTVPVGGSMVFYDGTTALGTVPIASGVATLTTTSLGVGSHSLSGVASGDAANLTGTTNVVAEVVNATATTTVLGSNNSSVSVGTSVTLTASVSNGTAQVPTGTVQFTDGAAVLGSVAVSPSGQAVLVLSTLTPGVHSIVAVYSGDTNDQGSQSAALNQTVQPIATTTTLTASANPSSAGATEQLTAHVVAASTGGGALTGNVTFSDGASTLGAVALDASGNAVLSLSTLSVGSHAIVATYAGSTNYTSSASSALAIAVKVTATTTVLTSAATSTLAGQPVNLLVAVQSATGVPTGTVTILDGATSLGTATLSATGGATFATSTLSVGTHKLTAVYAGDGNYTTSTSAVVVQVVSLATTTLTLAVPSAPVNAGLTITVTAALGSNGVAPTGTVTLLDGGKSIASQTVTGAGGVTFAGLGLAVGSHTLTAVYAGDANNAAATSAPSVVVVQQGASSETLTASVNPQMLGQSVTLTATVNSASPNVSGTVIFSDGGSALATVAVSASGVATYTTSGLTAGSHAITAAYGGDANHVSSSAALTEVIVQAATVTVGSSVNPSVAGNSVTFTAKVAGAGKVTPSGSVTFMDGATLLGTATLDATGTATVQTATLSVGSHTIAVSYAGDSNYGAANGVLIQTVQSASTQMTLTASANPATYGKAVSFTATITSNGGVATGNVSFTVDGSVLGTVLLNASGAATLTTSSLTPGTHTVVANYAGDGKASAASSTPLQESVLEMTAVALTTSANPAQTLMPVTLTAVVSNAGVGVATGLVTWSDGSVQLGTMPLDTTGKAALLLPQLSAGTHNIVASYAGDADDAAANSAMLVETVNLQATTTTMTSAPNDPANVQSVLLIAVVHAAGTVLPTGTMTFSEGTQVLGSAPVDATGVATLSVVVQQGTNNITATYSGDGNFASSVSQVTSVTGGVATGFALQMSPPAMTMQSTQHGVSTLTVTSLSGFTDTIAFGCLGLPFAATCTFSQATEKLGANQSVNVQVTVDTGNPLGAGALAERRIGSTSVMLCLLPAGLLLLLRRRKQRLLPMLLAVAAFALTLTATGCAGLSMSSTPAGTYSFKVTASGQGTGVTQSQVMTLTVTQ